MDRSAEWLKEAKRDLAPAEVSARAGHHNWAAFQAQQTAEKAVKALVQHLHGSVRGHAVKEILGQLPPSLNVPTSLLRAAQELDKVYLTSRYPNAFASGTPSEYFDEENSRELIGYAREILEFCRSQVHRP